MGWGEPMAGSPQTAGKLAEVKFLTVAEVAALMRVSKMTVYRLGHSGELTAVRGGRSFRGPEKAGHDYLRDAFIEAGRAEPPPSPPRPPQRRRPPSGGRPSTGRHGPLPG